MQDGFHRSMRLTLVAGLAVVAATGVAVASVSDLSADAQKIVVQVEKENPDIHPVCSSVGKLKAAVTQATTELAKENALTEDPHAAGEEAGKYLYENCPAS